VLTPGPVHTISPVRSPGPVHVISPGLPRPSITSLAYGRFRPQGAPRSYLALKLVAAERGGQIIETEIREVPSGMGADGDSACGLGGRRNGRQETFFLPLQHALSPGRHRIRVTVIASACTQSTATSKSTKLFTLQVA
jgi:hypothetical protein